MKQCILHLTPALGGGGAERQLTMLAIEQARRGWNVHIGVREGGVYLNSLLENGVHISFLGDHRGINPLLLLSITRLIARTKPDVVQTWLPQMDIVGGLAAILKSVPWVVSERSSKLGHSNTRIRTWIRCNLAKKANAVVANSLHGVEYWREILLGASTAVFRVPNAVDVNAIQRAASPMKNPETARDGARILVVGRLVRQKAVDIVIEAIRLLPVSTSVQVLIVGDGPMRTQIETLIEEANLNKRIQLVSFKEDWWSLFQSTSALVSMSQTEGQPNVVLEAMAAKCPVIVSDIPEHREFLDSESASLVPTNNAARLAEAIVALVRNPAAAQQRAAIAVGKLGGLTTSVAADSYEAVYRDVIKGGN